MLYLLRSFTRGGSYLKVGYTGNLEKRMASYLTENPGRELVGIRGGDMKDETRMHLFLEALGCKAGFLDEWFLDNPLVLEKFHESTKRIDKLIWKNRDLLFTGLDFSRQGYKVQIYEDLRFLFKDTPATGKIDQEWRAWNMSREIQARKKLIEEGWLEFV